MAVDERQAQSSLTRQTQVLLMLQGLPVGDAIGAACSFLLQCAYIHRSELRRVLHEPVIKEGLVGISLLAVFKRACQ